MSAKYIYRMDDITPDMNWEKFWNYMSIFKEYGVVPLLGVVPENRDTGLSIGRTEENFWEIIRGLQKRGEAEIAQHGFRHILKNTVSKSYPGGIYGFKHFSEFAGICYSEQYGMIKNGKDILQSHGIFSDIWMAPYHSSDKTTLKVLKKLGFRYVTDGIALYPFKYQGLIFIPQQLWQPRRFPFGVFTVCLHINDSDDELYSKVKNHLKSGSNITSFNAVKEQHGGIYKSLMNILFSFFYSGIRYIRIIMRKSYER